MVAAITDEKMVHLPEGGHELPGGGSIDQRPDFHGPEAIKRQPPPYVRSLSPEERVRAEKQLVRKIDLRMIPMIILMQIMNWLDRGNIAVARLGGLEEDLKLNGNQYQTAVAIFYVGYILMQVPSNLFLNKIGRPSIYLPTTVVVWGIVGGAAAGTHNFVGILMTRFFLGFIEAAYFPGCLYFLSTWYTKKELGLRVAWLFSGSMAASALSGLIAAGIIGGMDGTLGLRAWRWLFIIEGAITIITAAAAYFLLPDFPRSTKWLKENEKELATWRLDADVGEDDWISSQHQTFWQGMKMALLDYKMWVLLIIYFCIISSASVTIFFPTIIQTLNYTGIQTLLLTVPPYVLAVITALINAWHADKTGERYHHTTIPFYVAVIAFTIAATTTSRAPRYLAMMLMPSGVFTGNPILIGWITHCLPRPPAKRAAALAIINTFASVSTVYSTYLFIDSTGPRYVLAMSVCAATAFVAIIMATVLRFILVRLNKKLDRGEYVEGRFKAMGEHLGKMARRVLDS